MHCSVYSIYTIHSPDSSLAKQDITFPLPYAGTWDIPKINPGKQGRLHPGHFPDVNSLGPQVWGTQQKGHKSQVTDPA